MIGLHVVDDNFLQPEPGVSASDHLVSGLLPLGLLIGAAAIYPRMRAGLRGVFALVFGVLGVVGGTEAAYYAQDVGLSGHDYTGLLSIGAGFLLLGVGAVTLWRSRRRTGISPGGTRGGLCMCSRLCSSPRSSCSRSRSRMSLRMSRRLTSPPRHLGAPYENVQFTTSDGYLLKGWYVPSKNRAVVISFPGRSGTRLQARMLARHGYGVLLFDRRGEGESEGDWNVFGWHGERDLHAAVAFLRGRQDVDPERIGEIGRSVGGEMLIGAAAESDAFKAIVSEGGSSRSVRDDVANYGWGLKMLPAYALSSVQTAFTAVFKTACRRRP